LENLLGENLPLLLGGSLELIQLFVAEINQAEEIMDNSSLDGVF
jgi:hypothetical protein